MFDPQDKQVSVETSHGHRPSSSTGDRLLIGLAVLALVGGGLIGISKVLPAEAADATATPRPSSAPSATPAPTGAAAQLRTFTISYAAPPGTSAGLNPRGGGWARALRTVRILATPSNAADAVGELRAGDAAFVSDDVGRRAWLHVEAPLIGWIPREVRGSSSVQRFERHGLSEFVTPDALFAGPGHQFLFGGWDSATGSYILGVRQAGNRWHRTDPPLGTDYVRAAYGPHGWIALSLGGRFGGPAAWLWQSDDGVSWSSLGDASSLVPAIALAPIDLVGSPDGYVMTPLHTDANATQHRVLYSTDGTTWLERPIATGPDVLLASGIGYYAYSARVLDEPVAAYSPNGFDWAAVDTSDLADVIGVAGSGDELVALGRPGGQTRAWSARIEAGRLTWHRDPTSDGAFVGAVVTAVGGGSAAIATGWARRSETPLWWNHDAAGWHRHQLPASFVGLPRLASASTDDYVVVGGGAGALGRNPIMWASTGSDQLQPERHPFLAAGDPVNASTCAQYTGDLLDMLMNPGLAYPLCRGSGSIALRAYALPCQDCGGVVPASLNDASWLAQPTDSRTLRLGPLSSGQMGWLDGVLSPGLPLRRGWEDHWLSVTGHFDDPASPRCRLRPADYGDVSYPGAAEVISDCRGRFVVTEVRIER